ncbi:membrane protein insertion efficiency factor YidD [bacterium (Candidatus Gribaldobacteria) CG07_land_8_20_14_0_80_33_18]|uniref:Putative membrane protein insertion efficiency factor n=1 Tax=bacterium (Candidatus Gribaldobacteria) CG07_land_8_20_14_0_80_33_18 TaxID=2014272 RepID=A0A2M6Z2E5_9BACT|nr:membrane protein insertion efficiency factor YidD [bacterium]PIR90134.1 MAG: membrane protein insertion efficiency factor YidD [bacterium (Candidatus Gribaldobacteria) CG10_big_fil_rev_8_21_14_0_10_33_41]PIU46556.1 MAG: membrane protein insertion efficiency factor YidD [bacterium (Candidatus Gribaldobacteria) CG07_land_8_20_14_0_80_33_18]PJA01026.1 MAG: membrane protein insertion efficiency factor YidD [bacterium (Candidatus Gribaldobacteria) CG_4_10_14_0_2_um_filter_33_15]PJB08341.1 MAG: me
MIKKNLILTIKFYQKFISPYLTKNCRFYPSCSDYCINSIEKYGIFKGLFFCFKRILKCNYLFKGGIDPVK